jgi:2-aminoethylphosphonate-pyruvate transaminase
VQVVAGLVEALRLLEAEGGPAARLARYRSNFAVLSEGMGKLGYELYLDPAVQAPIIATFRPRLGEPFDFEGLHRRLSEQGFEIYPGKLTQQDSFRIGCIGDVYPADMDRLLIAMDAITT